MRVQVDPAYLTELFYLARTIYGEARGEGEQAMRLVAWVIRNRVEDRRWPNTYAEVVTQRLQFSCWNEGDPNRERMNHPMASGAADVQAWHRALVVADEVMEAPAKHNMLPGVYHYVDVSLEHRLPEWARNMLAFKLPQAPRIIWLKERG